MIHILTLLLLLNIETHIFSSITSATRSDTDRLDYSDLDHSITKGERDGNPSIFGSEGPGNMRPNGHPENPERENPSLSKAKYAFIKSKTHCLKGFEEFTADIDKTNYTITASKGIDVSSVGTTTEIKFCGKEHEHQSTELPVGSYCVFKVGHRCPYLFIDVAITFTEANQRADPVAREPSFSLCCQTAPLGEESKIDFDGVFSLIRFGNKCPNLKGKNASDDWLKVDAIGGETIAVYPDETKFEVKHKGKDVDTESIQLAICTYGNVSTKIDAQGGSNFTSSPGSSVAIALFVVIIVVLIISMVGFKIWKKHNKL